MGKLTIQNCEIEEHYIMILDTLIIGAGPAGIQAGYFLKKAGMSYTILEKADKPGAFFDKYPRHGTLISINKKYTGHTNREFNLRHDWNSLLSEDGPLFTEFDEELFPSAESLVEYLAHFVEKQGISIDYNSDVKSIDKQDGIFKVTLTNGEEFNSKQLVVATGFSLTRTPKIKGIEHATDYSVMSVDKKDFQNKRVLIIGKGNSAFETADHLAGSAAVIHMVSETPLRMAWQTHYVGNLRAVNNNILDMYQLKSQHTIMDATVNYIEKTENGYHAELLYTHAENEVEGIDYDEVLCCAGFKIDESIFTGGCQPEFVMDGKFPDLTHAYESTNISDLYFAGVLTHSMDFRKGTSGFIHGFRYNTKALVEILNKRNNNVDHPSTSIASDEESVVKYLIGRLNVVSSIWQQPAVLGEVFKLNAQSVDHFEALPLNYVTKEGFAKDEIITMTLEYGPRPKGDVFNQERIARDNYEKAAASQFLHPVLRHYSNGNLIEEFHVIEDLEAHWTYEEHFDHINSFISGILNKEQKKTA